MDTWLVMTLTQWRRTEKLDVVAASLSQSESDMEWCDGEKKPPDPNGSNSSDVPALNSETLDIPGKEPRWIDCYTRVCLFSTQYWSVVGEIITEVPPIKVSLMTYLHNQIDISENCVKRHQKELYEKNKIDPICENCVMQRNLLDCVNRPLLSKNKIK
jgi:hypothetical protein